MRAVPGMLAVLYGRLAGRMAYPGGIYGREGTLGAIPQGGEHSAQRCSRQESTLRRGVAGRERCYTVDAGRERCYTVDAGMLAVQH